jgi:hypothetical protein
MRRPFNPRNHRTWPACLSCARVAKILGFRPATVRDMARRGLLPVVPHTGSDRIIISAWGLKRRLEDGWEAAAPVLRVVERSKTG